MIDCHDDPTSPPDEDDMDPLISGMHPSEWPTVDDLNEVTRLQGDAVHEVLQGSARSICQIGEDS